MNNNRSSANQRTKFPIAWHPTRKKYALINPPYIPCRTSWSVRRCTCSGNFVILRAIGRSSGWITSTAADNANKRPISVGQKQDKRKENESVLIRTSVGQVGCLTAGVVGLLLTGEKVGQAGLLLRLVQDIVPIGSEEGAAVKVDCSGYVTQDT